jgi:hypothetical protein
MNKLLIKQDYSPIKKKEGTTYTGMSIIDRAKDIIERKHLFRIKEVFEKSGIMK